MELADPQRSYAVLVGCSGYADDGLEDLPAVANNVVRLGELLTDPGVWGLPPRHCRTVVEPASPGEVLDAVHEAAALAADTLLVYYAGHGLTHPDSNALLLALGVTDPQRPYTAVNFEDVRRAVLATRRDVNRVVVLDCCYGGLAMEGRMSGPVEMAEQSRIAGSYLLTACAATRPAQAPPGETYTAFTGELIGLLERGLPGGEPLIEATRIYDHLYTELRAKNRPLPQQRLSNTGRTMAFARNRYEAPRAMSVAPRAAETAAPAVPERWREVLRGRPRAIAAEAVRLRAAAGTGDSAAAGELLGHAAVSRPAPEVATLLTLLDGDAWRSERERIRRGVASRGPDEIVACVEALHALDEAADTMGGLLATVAGRPSRTVAATAAALKAAGYGQEAGSLLAAARSRLRTAGDTGDFLDLAGALWSSGLDDEADEVLTTATLRSPHEAAAFADALLTIGRADEAFELYASASAVVAARPAAEVTRVLRAMDQAIGQPTDQPTDGATDGVTDQAVARAVARAARDSAADQGTKVWSLLRAAVHGRTPVGVAELYESLSAAGLDAYARETLASVARAQTDTVLAVADALWDRGRGDVVPQVLGAAGAACPVDGLPRMVDALREMGRPVDANLLIAEVAGRAPGDVLALGEWFADHSRSRDRERLLTALDARPAADRINVLSTLTADRMPLPDHPEILRLARGLALADENDLLAVLRLLHRNRQPVAMCVLLHELVLRDPELAERRMGLFGTIGTRSRPVESAVLRALLGNAGRLSVRPLNAGDVRDVVSRRADEENRCYAMAALCAAGRRAEVEAEAALTVNAGMNSDQIVVLLRHMHGYRLTGCAHALLRASLSWRREPAQGPRRLADRLRHLGLDDYAAFAASAVDTPRPPGVSPPAPA